MAAKLLVRVDGELLSDDRSREVWQRFSDYMEAHRGDLAGFAQSEGYGSAHPALEGGLPLLVLSRTSPQAPYVTATAKAPPGAAGGGRPVGGGGPNGGGKRRRR